MIIRAVHPNGKFYYYKSIEALGAAFTPQEIRESDLSVIYRASVIGTLSAYEIADEIEDAEDRASAFISNYIKDEILGTGGAP